MTQALKAVRHEALRDGALGDRLALWAQRFKWVGSEGCVECGRAECERDVIVWVLNCMDQWGSDLVSVLK